MYLWIQLVLFLFGEFECGSNEAARRIHQTLVRRDGNIFVSNTKLKLDRR